ncbi:hypothetical protein BRADI_3g24693v3 [Brachypodium distachyon]|uniref:Uncharacterized protein n=1 Tax=Brachypodium distachyon TaxID=15368 RepID=A0A0Q3LW81_BRADI|nr:hypothetical protein BRADI_3g24693v3 [Brachypodium distachyon]
MRPLPSSARCRPARRCPAPPPARRWYCRLAPDTCESYCGRPQICRPQPNPDFSIIPNPNSQARITRPPSLGLANCPSRPLLDLGEAARAGATSQAQLACGDAQGARAAARAGLRRRRGKRHAAARYGRWQEAAARGGLGLRANGPGAGVHWAQAAEGGRHGRQCARSGGARPPRRDRTLRRASPCRLPT